MIGTKFKRYDGFTLIELIIVFTIIGILGGLSFFVLTNHLIRSRDTKRKFDVNSIVMGLSMYYMQKRNYPEPSDYIKILDDKSNIIGYQGSFDVAVVNKGIPLENIPLDPQDKKDYLYTKAIDPISGKMRYEVGSLMEHYLNGFDFVSGKSFFKKYPYIFQGNAILRCSDDGQLFFPSQLSIINNKYYYFLNSSNAGDNVEVKLDLSNMTGDCEGEISAPIIDLTGTNLIIDTNDIQLTLTQ